MTERIKWDGNKLDSNGEFKHNGLMIGEVRACVDLVGEFTIPEFLAQPKVISAMSTLWPLFRIEYATGW